jgi:hypothetical protein
MLWPSIETHSKFRADMGSTFRLALAIKLVIFMVQFPIAVSSDTGSKCSKNEMRDNPYDYIIVGGGITGLVVANRLTENDQSKLPRFYQQEVRCR